MQKITAENRIELIVKLFEEALRDVDGLDKRSGAIEIVRQLAGLKIAMPSALDLEAYLVAHRMMSSLRRDVSAGNASRLTKLFGTDRRFIGVLLRNTTGDGLVKHRLRRGLSAAGTRRAPGTSGTEDLNAAN